MDIPNNLDSNRIKGALRPFGKLIKFQLKQGKKGNIATFDLQKTNTSKDINKKWAIPLGDNLARVAPTDNISQVLKERNNFTARLYGIPKQASTIILAQELKHVRGKTFHIPTCSVSNKRRSFAIVSFESYQDLEKACSMSAHYNNHKLTWSKSNKISAPPQFRQPINYLLFHGICSILQSKSEDTPIQRHSE
jgi:hypothetical protein